jgi:tight adherence protein C
VTRPNAPGALRGVPDQLGMLLVEHMPSVWCRGLSARLTAVGDDRPGHLRIAIGVRAVTAAVGVLAGSVVVAGPVPGGALAPVVALAVALGVASLPDLRLRHATSRRRVALRRHLPRLLDLLTISVEAGLGFDQALGRAVRAVPPPLATEFARLQAEILAGVPRVEALRTLALRCPIDEMRSFALAMTQVETFGVPVAPILRAQAEDIRVRHRQDAQERAQKAPVKMLVPLVACVFPALLVVVAGPAVLSIRTAFTT